MDTKGPLSIVLPRQEYWSRLPFPSPGDLPNPGIKQGSPASQEDSLWSEPLRKFKDLVQFSSVQSLSRVQLFATPWTICSLPNSHSMGFSRQGYWNGLPFPSSGDLPDPGIEPRFPSLQTDSSPSEPQRKAHFGL